jgi:hypothetical protein
LLFPIYKVEWLSKSGGTWVYGFFQLTIPVYLPASRAGGLFILFLSDGAMSGLFIVNLVFYGWGEPSTSMLMLVSIGINYAMRASD